MQNEGRSTLIMGSNTSVLLAPSTCHAELPVKVVSVTRQQAKLVTSYFIHNFGLTLKVVYPWFFHFFENAMSFILLFPSFHPLSA
ncbi:hypothetical protein SODALDRAFT_355039 [Sodiomyces alkalinus F11]|uniref:Uncharacterized protein n=1 Tax=Sodiomyces alkalinus (strain CBS 110278 / VKM F-3762 / F11) TaxID=1314773 RepID=A0A3N2Q867_SODAK|nr:hypothetical protein SODALDRAFT_355039 [Sodiomyces alkalinus F11]ROT42848.1 hypothetical protein SODALDRAFT_355039 [Sodiomyces alkalinus F11]